MFIISYFPPEFLATVCGNDIQICTSLILTHNKILFTLHWVLSLDLNFSVSANGIVYIKHNLGSFRET